MVNGNEPPRIFRRVKLRCGRYLGGVLLFLMIHTFKRLGQQITQRFQESLVVVPSRPLEHSKLKVLDILPRPMASHHFCFKSTIEGLCEHIVVRVANVLHGRFYPRFDQAFAVAYRHILHALCYSELRYDESNSSPACVHTRLVPMHPRRWWS